jgi:hypothetical protein
LAQLLFVAVQLHHAHLDASLHYEPHHLDLSQLTDAVHSLYGLVFNSRIPPGVHQKHLICCHQVETDACCFERDDEDANRWVFLEFLYDLGAIFVRRAALHALNK